MEDTAVTPAPDPDIKMTANNTLTPPTSEDADKHGNSDSELSDLELDKDDGGDILPDHYYEGGKIPVFKPTMDQFRSFNNFILKIDKYGMKSGIVKVIPPKEWRDALPQLDEQVKTIKVKNPITQEFHGAHGTYTQANMEKQRSYNLPQWKSLSEESNHQPPARRGERRRNQDRPVRGMPSRAAKAQTTTTPPPSNGKKRGPGRPRVRPLPTTVHKTEEEEDEKSVVQVPPTPTSPSAKPTKVKKEVLSDEESVSSSKPKGRQPKSVSSRRKHNRRDQADIVDEEAFKDFDYHVYNQDEWTTERCQELEAQYWKSLTYNNPMYGADMPGSLFDDSTESWNVAKLENLLDVLGQKVPGVNTAYLYLGMWKATFAWHLEDVDLYSINYIHFGAPKQWYSISQEDARRFEAAMRSVWPNDAKNCDQFLRHKTYLISPAQLQSRFNIRVNRLVHNEGEFVITFPYGYHSGYNLGYNCAESVNFATESWLDFGRVAKKCNCEDDSVWIDVEDVERKLRGEATPEYYEETDDDDELDDDDEDGPTDLPTPPGSDKGRTKARPKRKRETDSDTSKPKIKRLRIKLKAPAKEPCTLCPNDNSFEVLLPTDNGLKAHRRCGLYTPETSVISGSNGNETIVDVAFIDKARLELKCVYCRNKRGAVFQCSSHKCTRAYHATCAASAGVQVDQGDIPVFGEDGTEYIDTGIDFRCRFHREKREKDASHESLEKSPNILRNARRLSHGEIVQVQYLKGDIFAGVVLENRKTEQVVLLEILPRGQAPLSENWHLLAPLTVTSDKYEVEYKYLLFLDPAKSQRQKPSDKAIPLPAHLSRKSQILTEDPLNDLPKPDDYFTDAKSINKWSEINTADLARNPHQVKIDLDKVKTLWHYLGKTSTEAKAQYTGDLNKLVNDLAANFLESVKPALPIPALVQRRSLCASYPNVHLNHPRPVNLPVQRIQPQAFPAKPLDRPYNGKYAIKDHVKDYYKPKVGVNIDSRALQNQRAFQQTAATYSPSHARPQTSQYPGYTPSAMPNRTAPTAPMAPMAAMGSNQRRSSSSTQATEDQRWKHSSNYSHSPNAKPPSHSSPQQTVAPVANMMSSTAAKAPTRNPFSRPSSAASSARHSQPASNNQQMAERARSDSIKALQKYPYLYDAAMKRATVYQSPYLSDGGYSPTWLSPDTTPQPKTHTSRPSLSEDFLQHRTPEQRDRVKAHVRKASEDHAVKQQYAQEEKQRRLSVAAQYPNKRPRTSSMSQPVHSRSNSSSTNTKPYVQPFPVYQNYGMTNYSRAAPPPLQNLQTHGLPQQYQPPPYSAHPQSASPHQLHTPSTYQSFGPNPMHHSPPVNHHYSPTTYTFPHATHHPHQSTSPTGLQFQSPQDFQAQMMQVSRQQSANGSWGPASNSEAMFRGLGGTANGGHGHSDGSAVTGFGGMEGPPVERALKRGRATSGGEMLPVMGLGSGEGY